MTYNQVQSFQINDYANHYVDIEITGYSSAECCTAKVLQAGGSYTYMLVGHNRSVSDCYIRVYRFWKGTANF